MLKLAGEFIEGQLADHKEALDAHTKNIFELHRTGEYLGWGHATANIAITANRLYAYPLFIARNLTIDRIAMEVATAGAGGTKVRLGIYNGDGTNLYPGSLLLDAGEVAVDSTGIKTITISQALTKGLYWVAMVSDGTPTVKANSNVTRSYWMGIRGTSYSYHQQGWYVAHTYGALPDPFTAGGTIEVQTLMVLPRLLSLD
jgi:hypothetical protein